MDTEHLYISPLFQAMARPAMLFGVEYSYFLVEGMLVLYGFFLTKNLWLLALIVPLHIVGYLACRHDPLIFRVWLKRLSFRFAPNKKLWRVESYEPF